MAARGQLEEGLDRLYGLGLDDFTSERDALVKALRADGHRDEAGEAAKARKPTVAAWALNQLVRERREGVGELLAAGEALRQAQAELLGGGGRGPLDQAAAEERRLVAELSAAACELLERSGVGVSAAVRQRLEDTLRAAALDQRAGELLSTGRLAKELEPTGVGPFSTVAPAAPREQASGSKGAKPKSERARERAEAAERAERERRVEQLARDLAREQKREAEAREKHAEARRALREARDGVARATSALERAEAAQEHRRERAEEAAAKVREARRRLAAERAG